MDAEMEFSCEVWIYWGKLTEAWPEIYLHVKYFILFINHDVQTYPLPYEFVLKLLVTVLNVGDEISMLPLIKWNESLSPCNK